MSPLSSQVKSVEAFQRDLEPAIIAARNELVTAENFLAYKNNYFIARYMDDGKTLYSFHTRMFFFAELDHAVVSATTRIGEETSTYYYTQGTPSDGSTGNPPQMIDQPGRIPDWFDPNLPPAGQG